MAGSSMATSWNTGRARTHRKIRSKDLPLLFMALPGFVCVILFAYAPVWGWSLALFRFDPSVGLLKSQFVGLKYFIFMFDGGYLSSSFLVALKNTLIYNAIGIVLSPAPMMLAIMLWEVRNRKLRSVLQTLMTLPNFISWVIVYSMFFGLFSMNEGAINKLLINFGIISKGVNLFADPNITYQFMTALGLWKSLGWSAIIYLAAIAGIDPELYQAAMVDGANRIRQIWHITVPGMLPTFAILFVLSVGGMMSAGFEKYFVFDNAMVRMKTDVIDTYVYRVGFGLSGTGANYSFSTAVSVFNTVVSVTLMLIANKVKKTITGQGIL